MDDETREKAVDVLVNAIGGLDEPVMPLAEKCLDFLIEAGFHIAEWRPIKDAPRDSTTVLIGCTVEQRDNPPYRGNGVFTGFYDPADGAWWPTAATFNGPFVQPTVFMDLPDPPKPPE